ncbi:hypothetical protein AB3S75_043771 [Citrus x aurantiifolia]
MISSKRLIKLARKSQMIASMGRKRISLPRTNSTDYHLGSHNKSSSSVAEKGHFVIYTTDQRRYVLPLTYLSDSIFLELLKLSEEEYGLTSDGPITLPCDAVFMDLVVSFIQRGIDSEGVQKAFLNTITTSRCLFPDTFRQGYTGQHAVVSGY